MDSNSTETLPVASILIPFHDRAAMTEDCLRSIAENCDGVAHEIILVDDASTERPDVAAMPNPGAIRVVRNAARKSYSELNNQAAAMARGEFLVLLNNDTITTPGWLSALIAAARREEHLGVLGNKHLYPDTKLLQHGGMGFDEKGFPVHLNPGTSPDTSAANIRRELQCVTFACALIPAKVFRELGGLDTAFRNGFEDVDFCLRARAAAYRVVYTPGSVIFHRGQSTAGRTDHDDANWRTFQERWSGKVKSDLHPANAADKNYNEQHRARPRLKREPEPGLHFAVDFGDANAFTWAAADLITALAKRNVPVSVPVVPFMHRSIASAKRSLLRDLMTSQPNGSFHIKWTHYWPKYFKQPVHGEVNAELFCTNYRYRPDGRVLDLWMRHVQSNEHKKLAVSGFNREALRELGVPDNDIAVVPLGYSPEIDEDFPIETPIAPRDRPEFHILLVTNSHDLHRYGTDLAVKALARAFGPGDPVIVHIKDYGSTSNAQLKSWIAAQPRFPRVEWHNAFLGKHDLLKLYANADVQLAPFRGEGFAMKICDAMAIGVPTMMPLFGGPTEYASADTCIPLPFAEVPVANGYDREHFFIGEGAYWCEPFTDYMADQLRSLMTRRDELARIAGAARTRVRSRYSWDAAAQKLMHALESWRSVRTAEVAMRRGPDAVPLSVVIPTRDRIEVLDKVLKAYSEQALPAERFELLLVNDHGERPPLVALAKKYPALPVKIFENAGPTGPAAARNLAIEKARGEIVLITGDDIVPARDFLKEHLDAHRRFPAMESAFVGLTKWHPDLPRTPFMDHITGKGGQQFSYTDMEHDQPVMFDRMYTSNCSLKRAFLIEESGLFSTKYRYAAYEDVELAYRLWLRGMELRYTQSAIGYHLHEMNPRSFILRQYKVGRMMTLLAIQRPSFMSNEHMCFLRALEFLRSWPAASAGLPNANVQPQQLLEQLEQNCEAMLSLNSELAQASGRSVVDLDRGAWQKWIADGLSPTWEATNELVLRLGMAEEWAQRSEDVAKAQQWIQVVALPRIVGHTGLNWQMPFAAPEFSAFLFPQSQFAYRLSKFIRGLPVVGRSVTAFERSTPGQYTRNVLAHLIRGAK
jgi:GT2 family glycosyltransferase/glycosyltransferase involved in cell wall biosynthesis